MIVNRLPVAHVEQSKLVLSDPYDRDGYIECSPYGQMADGSMVWADEAGNQYLKQRFFGKYYFCQF